MSLEFYFVYLNMTNWAVFGLDMLPNSCKDKSAKRAFPLLNIKTFECDFQFPLLEDKFVTFDS